MSITVFLRFICLSAAFAAGPWASICAAVEDKPIILVAPEGRPNTYVDNGAIKGFYADVVREAFRRSHRAVEIRILPWLRCIEEARLGRVDGMFVVYRTPEREEYFDYPSEPLGTYQESAYVRAGSPLAYDFSLASLARKRVGVIENSYHGNMIDVALKSGRFGVVVTANDYKILVNMLVAGRIDVVLSGHDPIIANAGKLGVLDKIEKVSPDIEAVPTYLVFTKLREMAEVRDDFDAALQVMHRDGSYDHLYRKYFP